MNQVVNFLSLLAVTEEQGGVKRMLGVCAEFERIARVVLEKGDKESHSRRKRRSSKINETDESRGQTPQRNLPQKRAASSTPQSSNIPTPQNIFTPQSAPSFSGEPNTPQTFNPNLQGFSPSLSDMNLTLDFSGPDYSNMMSPSTGATMDFPPTNTNANASGMENQQFSNDMLNVGSFQQPFVPQDLWSMPMTFEWDWGAMDSTNGVPAAGFEAAGQQAEQADGGMNGMNGHMQL